ncbi:hydroxyacid dehydrogenase [Dysosmobacter sp. Phy]
MEKVFVSEPIHQDAVQLLRTRFQVIQGSSTDHLAQEAAGCAGMLVRVARVDAEVMDALPQLRVIAKHGIGVDNIDVDAATARGIQVVNAPTANIHAVAEHTAALILALLKDVVVLDRATRSGEFSIRSKCLVRELRGKTVGLVGYGRIARLVHQKLSGFDVHFIAYDPYMSQEQAETFGIQLLPLETLLRQADVVSLHTPLSADTYHLINAETLACMKPEAVLINASRGGVVDSEALYQALRFRKIAGAALDVFEPEPPQTDSPLWSLDNLIVTPHTAALSDAAMRAMGMDSAQGIMDTLTGESPQYPVNHPAK